MDMKSFLEIWDGATSIDEVSDKIQEAKPHYQPIDWVGLIMGDIEQPYDDERFDI